MNQKIAFLFPGQGAQYVGMLRDLYAESEQAKAIIREADELLGYSLSTICFEGPAELLQQTENTQPAIFLHGYVLLALLREEGIRPDAAAGHSLGEYTALVAAGALTFRDALRLVRLRGQLMQKAGEDQPGTMAAIIGLDNETVTAVCNIARQAGIVQPANFNAPGQIVISGSIEGVTEAMQEAKSRGARLVRELVVSGAFHSPLMQSAQDELGAALADTQVETASIPVYANVTAEPVTEPDRIRTMLREQIIAPVKWERSIRNMIRDGSNEFLEVGPGRVLQGLLKRIDANAAGSGVDTYADVRAYLRHYSST
jgi:[acyl-carrier-protein] S-malonyltransferase